MNNWLEITKIKKSVNSILSDLFRKKLDQKLLLMEKSVNSEIGFPYINTVLAITLGGLTAVFGMGTGEPDPVWPFTVRRIYDLFINVFVYERNV